MFQRKRRGFTLVELMIVVAIIGVLAALAIYGVRRYLASSKTSEAKQAVGAISRGAASHFERTSSPAETLAEGSTSAQAERNLCGDAVNVPSAPPPGRKYQPNTSNNADYETGDTHNGWRCLRFRLTQPHYYQYQYHSNAGPVGGSSPAPCSGQSCYEAAAVGDLDADGVFSAFVHTGFVNTQTGQLKTSTQIYIENEFE